MLMLILTRRPHESIRLGSRVRISVLGFKGNQVRIGIEAPADVSIDREEIWARKQLEVRFRKGSVRKEGQPAAPVPAPLPEARPAGGSMPTPHEKARIL
jgi:carbon storage regulator